VLTLPPGIGTVTVVATSGEFSVTFTAGVIPTPSLFTDSVVDGVTFNSFLSFGPGSILAVSGQNLAQGTEAAAGAPLPTMLQSTRALLVTPAGDVALPLFSVSPSQVRLFLPSDTEPGTYGLRVDVASGRSNEIPISIAQFAPGIFALNENGRGPGLFFKEDGSRVTTANPAERGALVTLYAAGLGPVAEPLNSTIAQPRVFFDIYRADVVSSGLAADAPGRYQVTVRVPIQVSPATNISVSLSIGAFASNRVTIPVR
jgi:uncharacterized protein (TIGR03437 family)